VSLLKCGGEEIYIGGLIDISRERTSFGGSAAISAGFGHGQRDQSLCVKIVLAAIISSKIQTNVAVALFTLC
jgi:hypothetical protein